MTLATAKKRNNAAKLHTIYQCAQCKTYTMQCMVIKKNNRQRKMEENTTKTTRERERKKRTKNINVQAAPQMQLVHFIC